MLVGERYEDYLSPTTGPASTAYPVSGKSSLLEENRLELRRLSFLGWLMSRQMWSSINLLCVQKCYFFFKKWARKNVFLSLSRMHYHHVVWNQSRAHHGVKTNIDQVMQKDPSRFLVRENYIETWLYNYGPGFGGWVNHPWEIIISK